MLAPVSLKFNGKLYQKSLWNITKKTNTSSAARCFFFVKSVICIDLNPQTLSKQDSDESSLIGMPHSGIECEPIICFSI